MPRPNFAGVRRCSPVDRRFWYALGAIVLVALGLRVAYVLTVTRHEVAFNDSLYYISEASLLAAGDGFVEPFAQITHPHKPPPEVGDHPPLTSIVLLPGAALDDTLFMRFEMVVLGLGVVVLTGLLGRRVGGNATGLVAAGIAAVYPSLWTNDGLLMSETLATLLTVSAVVLTYRLFRTRRWLDAVALGAVIALDALTRAEFALLFPLLVLPVLWSLRDDRRLAITLGSAALATSLVVVAPWIGYNMARFDKPTLLSTGDGLALAGANQPKTYHGRLLGYIAFLEHLPRASDQSDLSQKLRRRAVDYALDHSDRWPAVVGARLGRVFSVFRLSQTAQFAARDGRPTWATWWANAMLWLLAPIAVASAIALRRRRRRVWPLLMPFIVVTIAAGLFGGLPRYRSPAETSLAVLAAVGLTGAASVRPRRPSDDAVAGRASDGVADEIEVAELRR